jgi:hypothetical protein
MENRNLFDFAHDFTDDEFVFMPKEVAADRPLTPEEIIIKQYRGGMTLQRIVKDNGTSYGRVYEILNRNGVELRSGRYNSKSKDRLVVMSKFERSSLISDYRAGLPMTELLEKYKINKHGCYTILDTAGVPRRQKKNPLILNIGKIAQTEQVELVFDTDYKPTPKRTIELSQNTQQFIMDGNTLHIRLPKNRQVDSITITFDLEEEK